LNNPYVAPTSDLGAEKHLAPKTLWKIFFWVLLVLEVLSLLMLLMDPSESLLIILFDTVIYSFILLGLFGFSYNRKIINRIIWAYVIPIGIVFDLYNVFSLGLEFETTDELYVVLGLAVAISLPLMIFQYLALFKYSFRSPEIWQ
jgi:hypothetical protein